MGIKSLPSDAHVLIYKCKACFSYSETAIKTIFLNVALTGHFSCIIART